jgi:hypothetical protein
LTDYRDAMIKTLVAVVCLKLACFFVSFPCLASEVSPVDDVENIEKKDKKSKKIGRLNIAEPYDEQIDMSIASHAEEIGGKFSTILENSYIDEMEQKKEADKKFRQ